MGIPGTFDTGVRLAVIHMDGHRILIATHDEELSGKLAHMLLRRYEVIQSFDGEEAIGLLDSAEPDFIVIDGELPKVDGFILTKTARRKQTYEKTPIFLFSSRSTRDDFNKGYEAGVTLYMAKPVDLVRLARQVDFTIQRDQIKIRVKHFSAEVLRHQGIKAQPKGGLKTMTRTGARAKHTTDVTPAPAAPPAPPPQPGAGLMEVLASITGNPTLAPQPRVDDTVSNGVYAAPPPPPPPTPPAQVFVHVAPPTPISGPPVRPWEDPAFADLDLDIDVGPHHTPPPTAEPAAAFQPPPAPPVAPPAPAAPPPPPALTTAPSNPNMKEEIARLIGAKLNLGAVPQDPEPQPPPAMDDAARARRIVFTDLIGANPPITPRPNATPQPAPPAPKPPEITAPRPKSRLNLSELIANIPVKPTPPPEPVDLEDLDLGPKDEAPNDTQTRAATAERVRGESAQLDSLLDKILN